MQLWKSTEEEEEGDFFGVELCRWWHAVSHGNPVQWRQSVVTSISRIIHKLEHRIKEYLHKIRQLRDAKANI